MPVKINELVIQVKVYESNVQGEHDKTTLDGLGSNTTEQQRIELARDLLHLLEDREAR